MAFVPRLGPAGAGLLAAFLAVRGGRLGGGARGLLRALQPQHQLDQFVLAQAFEIGASHDGRESASSVPRKGGAPAECSASCQPRRPAPWVITFEQLGGVSPLDPKLFGYGADRALRRSRIDPDVEGELALIPAELARLVGITRQVQAT